MAQDLSKLIVELGQIESRINEINIGLTKTNLLLDQTGKDRLSMMNKMKYGGSGNPELDRLSAQRDATAMQLKMRGGTAWGTIAGEGPTSKEISTAFEKNYQKLVQEATAQIKANVPKVVESSPTTPVVKTIGQAFEEHYTQLVREADAQIRASVAKSTEELMARMPGTLASSGATGMQGAKLASLDQTSNRFGRYTTPYTSTGTWERFGGGGVDPFSAGPMGTGKSPIDASRNAQSVIGDINKAFTGMDSVSDKTKQHITDDIMAEVKALEALGQKVDVVVNKMRNMGGTPYFSADIMSGGKSSTYGRGINPAGDLLNVDQMKRNQISNRLGVNPQAQEDFYRRLEEAKFNIGNVTKINTEAKSGRTVITAKQIDEATGAVREGTFAYNKYGTAINVASRQHQGFMDSIVRNTGELIKWSIGIGLVYGTMYKLQQLITMAVENQTKLIDVNVALGSSQRDVNAIFDDASAVARKTGENIGEVLDTYVIAYRAVGGIAEPMERTTTANKLLTDATILNKLANISAADAVDTLAGSLRQITKPGTSAADSFKQGAVLLDKWVAVSNKANVSLGDLAMAFSVTAESALNSGMSVDQLNASIAVLSEKIGGLGGKETGNAVRAIIGGVYQQQATDILNRYGIAVKDSSDQMRSFMTISQDVYDLYRSGIISEGELNKIAYVWGGGVRRGQQVVAWMKDQERMQQITAVSANANGEAQAALSKKMDSVQTSSVKVSNAFQGLAMAFAYEKCIFSPAPSEDKLAANYQELLD